MSRLVGLLLTALVLFSSLIARSESPRTSSWELRKKADAKFEKRWTLQEWLEQKNRNAMMDLWLAMNSPSPYEFFIGGASSETNSETSSEGVLLSKSEGLASSQVLAGAFAERVGLVGEYENNVAESYNDLSGALNVRLLGHSVQGTHLLLQAGARTRKTNGSGKFENAFASVDLNLYFTRYFGAEGLYRHYFESETEGLGRVGGTRSQAGLFLDFGPLRVFGRWYKDLQISNLSNKESQIDRSGSQTGLMIFF